MEIPNWEDIKIITDDLRFVLDAVGRKEADSIPGIRVKLARAIAQARDDKISLEFAKEREKPCILLDQYAMDFPVPFITD